MAAPVAALAGVMLLQQLMAQKAAAEENKRKQIFDAQQSGFEAQAKGASSLSDGEQKAYDQMMKMYGQSFLR